MNTNATNGNDCLLENYRELQNACIYSFLDECVDLKEDFDRMSLRCEEGQRFLKYHAQRLISVKKYEAEVLERSKALLASPDWEKNEEEISAIQKAADIVGQYKRDCKSGKIRSETSQAAYAYIVDCVAFSARIQRRKKFWKQFGIGQIAGSNVSEEVLTDVQRKYNGTTLMQQVIMHDAQAIFLLAAPFLSKAQDIKKELLKAVKKFNAKNILE